MISARWLGPDGLIWNEDWWQLPHDLEPGQTVSTGLTIGPRLPVGEYELRWDLLIDQLAYFTQFVGDAPVNSRAEIVSSPVAAGEHNRFDFVERQISIGRIDAWRVAWGDFTSSPIFGVGPNQFGDRVQADMAAEGLRVGSHAHNVFFEPLAAWGLAGALPFFLLALGAVVRTLTAAWRTQGIEACAVAVGLIAIAVHGLVDWPLVTVTTGIPVGLLLGLAWSDREVLDAAV